MVGILLGEAALVAMVTALLTWRFSRPASRFYLLDIPNERSLHSRPTPRGGGLAIALTLALAVGLWLLFDAVPAATRWIAGGGMALALISYWEDRAGVRRLYRLLGHIAVVGAMVGGGALWLETLMLPGAVWPLPTTLGILVTLLGAVWMVNLYNFMDGMDGLAGSMALLGFGTYAVFGWLQRDMGYAGANLMIAAAAAGFLVFNAPPARIFMGDLGSTLLGYLAAAQGLWGVRLGLFSPWVPVLVFAPFLLDATATLLRRMLRRERFWEAHRTHHYQRLVQLGWGHRRTLWAELVLMLLCAGLALAYEHVAMPWQWLVLCAWALLFVGAAWLVKYLERGGRPASKAER